MCVPLQKSPVMVGKTQKDLTSVTVCGLGQSLMISIFLGSVSIPSLETMCPKYANLVLKNLHFFGFNFSPAWPAFQIHLSNVLGAPLVSLKR